LERHALAGEEGGLDAGDGRQKVTLLVYFPENFRNFWSMIFVAMLSRGMAKIAVPPMPVEIVLTNPALMSASGPAYRLIVTLAAVFWCGECRPLPEDGAGLCALARCGPSSWRKDGAKVQEALATILPQLHRNHVQAVQRANNFRQARAAAGRKGANARWHKPKGAASSHSTLQEPTQTPLVAWPSLANGHRPNGLRLHLPILATEGKLRETF